MADINSKQRSFPTPINPQDVIEYWADAFQRSVLFLDVLRERGEHYAAHNAKTAPHVLKFEAQLVVDGRKLPRPVNYVLARIILLAAWRWTRGSARSSSSTRVPGTGRGSAASRPRSEIGVALKAGHPCYFIALYLKW